MLYKIEEQVISECTDSFVSSEVLQNYYTLQHARKSLWVCDWNVDKNQSYGVQQLDLRYSDTEVRKISRAQRKLKALGVIACSPSAASLDSTTQQAT